MFVFICVYLLKLIKTHGMQNSIIFYLLLNLIVLWLQVLNFQIPHYFLPFRTNNQKNIDRIAMVHVHDVGKSSCVEC